MDYLSIEYIGQIINKARIEASLVTDPTNENYKRFVSIFPLLNISESAPDKETAEYLTRKKIVSILNGKPLIAKSILKKL